ncbi:dTMP kinase [Alkalibacter mobilis]|uniref:dTMP kinase n=1 Tax=Alkalibacter mobilis TaxID=2787712 RepID=UPI00189DE69B|nr:thymidylate kinase [Alkalibacter mobilis]MBF7096103.1 thymidylate kinase [Alkalibacter mobilis]
MNKGKLIVIEGVDGSGKETQSKLLFEKLIKKNYSVMRLSYPRYEKESSALVKMYLRGDFGKDPDSVSPYISSTFFAADRYASFKTEYEEFYNNGGIVIADRYTTSNMMHQGGKIKDPDERNEFLSWLWDYEFNLYKIPVPDKVFFLNLPPKDSMDRIKNRKNKITQMDTKDIHEQNEEHIINAYNVACEISKRYGWDEIFCLEGGYNRTIEEINEEIYKKLTDLW